MWGKDYNKYTTSIIDDLLNSVKRLNEELNSRVSFEHNLLTVISSKDAEISVLKYNLENAEKQKDALDEKVDEMDKEIKKFVEFASANLLKPGEQFVRNEDGNFEIYPARPEDEKASVEEQKAYYEKEYFDDEVDV